jgi:hypothetical protein
VKGCCALTVDEARARKIPPNRAAPLLSAPAKKPGSPARQPRWGGRSGDGALDLISLSLWKREQDKEEPICSKVK